MTTKLPGPKARKDGTGSVYKRSDGKWVAQVRQVDPLTGKSRKIRRYATSRDAARALLRQLRSEPSATPQEAAETFAGYLAHWRTHRLPHLELAPRTRTIYGDTLKWYGEPAAGSIKLSDLDARTGQLWVAALRKMTRRRDDQPLSASTVRGTYVAAVRALDNAVGDGVIETNPLRSVERPTVPRAEVPVTSADDADALLAACQGRRVEHLAVFVTYTGVRIGEALALRWSDVDLVNAVATIRRGSQTRATTKTGRVRSLTLMPEVVAALHAQAQRQADDAAAVTVGYDNHDGLVFTSATGRALDRSNVTHELQSAARVAGVDPRRPWHSLRHGLAHRLLSRGVLLQVVSALLGHSGIGVTADVYGHVSGVVPADVLADALRSR